MKKLSQTVFFCFVFFFNINTAFSDEVAVALKNMRFNNKSNELLFEMDVDGISLGENKLSADYLHTPEQDTVKISYQDGAYKTECCKVNTKGADCKQVIWITALFLEEFIHSKKSSSLIEESLVVIDDDIFDLTPIARLFNDRSVDDFPFSIKRRDHEDWCVEPEIKKATKANYGFVLINKDKDPAFVGLTTRVYLTATRCDEADVRAEGHQSQKFKCQLQANMFCDWSFYIKVCVIGLVDENFEKQNKHSKLVNTDDLACSDSRALDDRAETTKRSASEAFAEDVSLQSKKQRSEGDLKEKSVKKEFELLTYSNANYRLFTVGGKKIAFESSIFEGRWPELFKQAIVLHDFPRQLRSVGSWEWQDTKNFSPIIYNTDGELNLSKVKDEGVLDIFYFPKKVTNIRTDFFLPKKGNENYFVLVNGSADTITIYSKEYSTRPYVDYLRKQEAHFYHYSPNEKGEGEGELRVIAETDFLTKRNQIYIMCSPPSTIIRK